MAVQPPIAPRGEVITGIMPVPIIVYTKAQTQTHFLTLVDTPASYKDYAGYPCVVNSAENALEFTRTFQANDASPVLTLDQNSTGINLLLNHATAFEVRFAEEDETDPAGRYRIRGVGGALHVDKALTASWATVANILNVDPSSKYVYLHSDTIGGDWQTRLDAKRVYLILTGQDAGSYAASLRLLTCNAAGDGTIQRLYVAGGATNVAATWGGVYHKNFVVEDFRSVAHTELTIASGVVTQTQFWHTIDTAGDAATDDLDTITAEANWGFILISPAHADRTIVVKHETDNISLAGEHDVILSHIDHCLLLVKRGTANWMEVARNQPSQRPYGEMYLHQSAVATPIEDANDWHLIRGFTAGATCPHWSHNAGSQKAITAYATSDAGAKTQVTSAGHGLSNGDIISISGTTSYDGVWVIEQVVTDTFVIATAYVADDGASTGEVGDWLEAAEEFVTGSYFMTYNASLTPSNPNEVFEMAIFVNGTQCIKCESQTKTGAVADYQVVSSGSIFAYTAGYHINLAIRNLSAGNDVTLRNANLRLFKLD